MTANPIASRVGSRGGANDYFVLDAKENVTKLEAAIQATMEMLRVSIMRHDLVMRIKARGGSSTRNDHH